MTDYHDIFLKSVMDFFKSLLLKFQLQGARKAKFRLKINLNSFAD